MKYQFFKYYFIFLLGISLSCKKQEVEVPTETLPEEEIVDTMEFTILERNVFHEAFVGFLISDKSGNPLLDSIRTEDNDNNDWVISFTKARKKEVFLTIFWKSRRNGMDFFRALTVVAPKDGLVIEDLQLQPDYEPTRDYSFKITGVSSIEDYFFHGSSQFLYGNINIEDDTAFIDYYGSAGLDQLLVLEANMSNTKKGYIVNSAEVDSKQVIDWAEFSDSLYTRGLVLPFNGHWQGDIIVRNNYTGNRLCIFNSKTESLGTSASIIQIGLPGSHYVPEGCHINLSGESDEISGSVTRKYNLLPQEISLDLDQEFEVIESGQDIKILFHDSKADYYRVQYPYFYYYHSELIQGNWYISGDMENEPDFTFPKIPEKFIDRIPFFEPIVFPRNGLIEFYDVESQYIAELIKNPFNMYSTDWKLNSSMISRKYEFEK